MSLVAGTFLRIPYSPLLQTNSTAARSTVSAQGEQLASPLCKSASLSSGPLNHLRKAEHTRVFTFLHRRGEHSCALGTLSHVPTSRRAGPQAPAEESRAILSCAFHAVSRAQPCSDTSQGNPPSMTGAAREAVTGDLRGIPLTVLGSDLAGWP